MVLKPELAQDSMLLQTLNSHNTCCCCCNGLPSCLLLLPWNYMEEGNCNLPVHTLQGSLENPVGIITHSGIKFGSPCSCKNSQKVPECQLVSQCA